MWWRDVRSGGARRRGSGSPAGACVERANIVADAPAASGGGSPVGATYTQRRGRRGNHGIWIALAGGGAVLAVVLIAALASGPDEADDAEQPQVPVARSGSASPSVRPMVSGATAARPRAGRETPADAAKKDPPAAGFFPSGDHSSRVAEANDATLTPDIDPSAFAPRHRPAPIRRRRPPHRRLFGMSNQIRAKTGNCPRTPS